MTSVSEKATFHSQSALRAAFPMKLLVQWDCTSRITWKVEVGEHKAIDLETTAEKARVEKIRYFPADCS